MSSLWTDTTSSFLVQTPRLLPAQAHPHPRPRGGDSARPPSSSTSLWGWGSSDLRAQLPLLGTQFASQTLTRFTGLCSNVGTSREASRALPPKPGSPGGCLSGISLFFFPCHAQNHIHQHVDKVLVMCSIREGGDRGCSPWNCFPSAQAAPGLAPSRHWVDVGVNQGGLGALGSTVAPSRSQAHGG